MQFFKSFFTRSKYMYILGKLNCRRTHRRFCTNPHYAPDICNAPQGHTRNLRGSLLEFCPQIIKVYICTCRLLSYMTTAEGSEVNHCCQVFANFSASVTMFIRLVFCINFVTIHFVTDKLVMYKLCFKQYLNYKLCYLTQEKLAIGTCEERATLYPTCMSVLYSAQCTHTTVYCVQICLRTFVFYFAC
jgi:hypothetical protein